MEEDQVSIGGPLAAELWFGCVLPGVAGQWALGRWGVRVLGGSREHGHLGPEAEFQTPKQRTPVGQTPLAAGACPFSLVPTGVSCALRVSTCLFRLTSWIEQFSPSSSPP